jgi:nucleotide-binding universal stress UspA family protein
MIKDILAYVDEALLAPSRFSLPMRLAQRLNSHLSACHVRRTPFPVMDHGIGAAAAFEMQIEAVERSEKEIKQKYTEYCRDSGLQGEWHLAKFWKDGLGLAARHDLVVVGEASTDLPRFLLPILPEDIAIGVGRPTLVVPTWGEFDTCGKRVVIAWKPTREATRAVHDALPIIDVDAAVTIVEVIEGSQPSGAERSETKALRLHLARQGVTANTETYDTSRVSVSETLLDRAKALNADLIVMGLYGSSRLREFVLGGVSRSMLRDMSVPLLVSH